jgi:small subunit ribosomal protein S4
MARYLGSKEKFSRRVGEKLPINERSLSAKAAVVRRTYRAGMHGQVASRRWSEYGQQLIEKQKAKHVYGLLERQFRRYFAQAAKQKGVTGTALIELLEMRLDNVVYRLGFASSRVQARQLVSHGFIEVGGKKVSRPSYGVRVGDVVRIRDVKRSSVYVQKLSGGIANHKVLDWLALDEKALSGKVIGKPTPDHLDFSLNTQLIVEHYSR